MSYRKHAFKWEHKRYGGELGASRIAPALPLVQLRQRPRKVAKAIVPDQPVLSYMQRVRAFGGKPMTDEVVSQMRNLLDELRTAPDGEDRNSAMRLLLILINQFDDAKKLGLL